MGFWVFMLIMVLLVPVIMLVFGKRFQDKPPQKINALYGYRTARSMRNQDTWTYAHQVCGSIWWTWGWALCVLSPLPQFFVIGHDKNAVGTAGSIVVAVQILCLCCSVFLVERALKKTFDQHGRRRSNPL